MSFEAIRPRRWVALGATLAVMVVGAVTSGGDLTRCEQACLAGGLTEQQMGFEEFRKLYMARTSVRRVAPSRQQAGADRAYPRIDKESRA